MSKGQIYEAGKSFWVYANSKENGCFNCGYCVLLSVDHLTNDGKMNNFRALEIGAPPGQIDRRMDNIPVAVNNAFGDPVLQWQDTLTRLGLLAEYEHQGVVALITKGGLTEQRVKELTDYPLRLVVFQSISGLKPPLEHVNYKHQVENIKLLSDAGIATVPYIRPIIPGFNDSRDVTAQILDDVAEAGAKIVNYAGLMGREEVITQIERMIGRELPPPEGFSSWRKEKKLISSDLRLFIEKRARENHMEVYRKTSCAASMAVGWPYDYNLHMFNPDQYNCCECRNVGGCNEIKGKLDHSRVEITLEVLKSNGWVKVDEDRTPCPLIQVCTHPLSTCYTPATHRLILNGEHTLGEIALARWLSNLHVSAEKLVNTTEVPNIWRL